MRMREFQRPRRLSTQQQMALASLFMRNDNGALHFDDFMRRVSDYGDYVGLVWCNMFIGVEPDGYTHS